SKAWTSSCLPARASPRTAAGAVGGEGWRTAPPRWTGGPPRPAPRQAAGPGSPARARAGRAPPRWGRPPTGRAPPRSAAEEEAAAGWAGSGSTPSPSAGPTRACSAPSPATAASAPECFHPTVTLKLVASSGSMHHPRRDEPTDPSDPPVAALRAGSGGARGRLRHLHQLLQEGFAADALPAPQPARRARAHRLVQPRLRRAG